MRQRYAVLFNVYINYELLTYAVCDEVCTFYIIAIQIRFVVSCISSPQLEVIQIFENSNFFITL